MTSQFWIEQYHTTIDKRKTGDTEIVNKSPSFRNNVVLFYFCDIISSTCISNEHQHTNKCSHQYHWVGTNDIKSSSKISIIWRIKSGPCIIVACFLRKMTGKMKSSQKTLWTVVKTVCPLTAHIHCHQWHSFISTVCSDEHCYMDWNV